MFAGQCRGQESREESPSEEKNRKERKKRGFISDKEGGVPALQVEMRTQWSVRGGNGSARVREAQRAEMKGRCGDEGEGEGEERGQGQLWALVEMYIRQASQRAESA